MPFRNIIQCTNCDWIGTNYRDHEDCPKDPMKDPVERAKYQQWADEYRRNEAAWEQWEEETGELAHATPSVREYPSDIAHIGFCVIVQDGDVPFVSHILKNPTWADVIREFDKAIPCTGDYHHVFLEGLGPAVLSDKLKKAIGPNPNVHVLQFSTGS